MLAVAASIAKNLDVLYNPEVNSSVLDATWAQLGGAIFLGIVGYGLHITTAARCGSNLPIGRSMPI